MDGIVFPGDGSMLVSRACGDLAVVAAGGEVRSLRLGLTFAGPSDIKAKPLEDGAYIVIVPEQDIAAPDDWKQRVHVVGIPRGEDPVIEGRK